ncbi:MAG: protein kinase [Planctomycetes bacterium]|nr:protein kinase [Planctomycetota bacterium]
MVTGDLGACEWFVWDLRRSGLIDRGQLDTIVGEFLRKNPRAEAPALAEYLVNHGTLTGFQAERVLNSKSAGLVLGPYVLLDAIGSGSMGQVYKASSKNDANLYAVKVLPRRSMWNVRLARRQVRSFANFTHPAVVPFMDVGTAGGLHYLVWPLVEGSTLESIVQHNGKLPPNLAALYGLQIAQGLTDAHQNSLFHGLVKPSNIMIGSDNQARMLDFGIGSLLVENEGESLVDTMSTANTLTSGLDCASPESIMEPTSGGMPALGGRPSGRAGGGSNPKMPGLPTKPAPAAPAPGMGNRGNPAAPAAAASRGGAAPGRSAPPPPPPPPPQRSSVGGPSRATLHLPPVAEEEDDAAINTGGPPQRSSPMDNPRGAPRVPTRGSSSPPPPPQRQKAPPLEPVEDEEDGAWAEEEPTRNSIRGGGRGDNGGANGMNQALLIALIIALMVGAFFAARLFM